MDNLNQNLKENKFKFHLSALLMMLLPPIPMYWAAQSGATGLIWLLMGIVVLGNLIVIFVP
jgi:hypothetical protein